MGDNATHTPPEQWPTYSGNRRTDSGFAYDAAGNVKNDGTQTYTYDATGQQTYASGLGAGGTAPTFTDDPLNPPNQPKTDIKLIHLTQLRDAVNGLRVRAGLAAFTNWDPDPNPTQPNVTYVHHNHITQLRTKLEEALNALHLPIGTYAHTGPHTNDPIYAIDFQELRDKIKGAWTSLASASIAQAYNGDGLRVKKIEYGYATYYIRSSVLGGQVLAELDNSGNWKRGYVYAGNTMMAVQQSGGVFWQYEDAITKSKRTTDINGTVVSIIETDPWGADTNRSSYAAFQPKKFTSYDRDGNGSDEAMFRRYNRKNSRFDQPDPYDGSYDLGDPQSFNRYAYVQNDPANFVDPSGLTYDVCSAELSAAQCMGNGFWGGGYLGGNGWGSDPRPGLRQIQWAEMLFDTYYHNSGHNWGNREGHLRGWSSDFDPQNHDSGIWCPPTGKQLASDPVVLTAIEQAWNDSNYDTPSRHEEAGWIYMNTDTAELSVIRAPSGGRASASLLNPPAVQGSILVGDFHTHPNRTGSRAPNGGTWDWKPDLIDKFHNTRAGVPGIVRSDHGVTPYGPKRRGSDPTHAGPAFPGDQYPRNTVDNRLNCS